MKIITILVTAALALGAAAADSKCYFCSDSPYNLGKGVYPTYDCGVKCGYKYHHTTNGAKCWRSTNAMNSCFKTCCKKKDKEPMSVNCGLLSWC